MYIRVRMMMMIMMTAPPHLPMLSQRCIFIMQALTVRIEILEDLLERNAGALGLHLLEQETNRFE